LCAQMMSHSINTDVIRSSYYSQIKKYSSRRLLEIAFLCFLFLDCFLSPNRRLVKDCFRTLKYICFLIFLRRTFCTFFLLKIKFFVLKIKLSLYFYSTDGSVVQNRLNKVEKNHDHIENNYQYLPYLL
jgi:hypothetical protein